MTAQSEFEVGLVNEGPPTSKRSRFENGEEGHADNLVKSKDTTKPRPNCKLGREVDDRIFTYVSDFFPFSTLKFGILQLGPLCNASKSCLFTEAACDIETVMNDKDVPLILGFNQLFSKGIELLSDLYENKRELEENELAAVRILDYFFKEKDQHEESLYKILQVHQSGREKKVYSETEIKIALAEHLLGKLSPGKSYIINSKVKEEGKCSCGFNHCKSDPAYGGTGIGHEETWHGFLDIIFSSDGGLPETAASFVVENQASETLTCPFDDGEDELEGNSLGRKTISEVKRAESQVVAQTIVFSFTQRIRHPHFSNFLIPNILISTHDFRIIMYDAVNDILMCSVPFQIFQPYPSTSLQTASILILWMVLHYRMFCVGIDTSLILETVCEMKNIQSNFKERAKEKLELYVNASKFGVQDFPLVPHVPRKVFPSHELLGTGVHLISQKSFGLKSAEF